MIVPENKTCVDDNYLEDFLEKNRKLEKNI